jgi:predicted enzyme related to lactoylglutathione lyase
MTVPTLGVTVLDCPDPRALAEFYGTVLDWRVEAEEGESDWVELAGPNGRCLAFQRSEGYQPPRWPSTDMPQQFHLDLDVPRDQMDAAEKRVLGLGATLLEGDEHHPGFRVYADPVGHPFCLCVC